MSKGGQRVDILHALHILWRVNTRPCVTWQKERTAKRVHRESRRRRESRGARVVQANGVKLSCSKSEGEGTFVRGDIEKSHKDNSKNNGKLTEASQR